MNRAPHHPSIHLNMCFNLPSPGAPIQRAKFHNLQIVRTYTHIPTQRATAVRYSTLYIYPDAAALFLANKLVWANVNNFRNKTKYYFAIRDSICVHAAYVQPVFFLRIPALEQVDI